MCACLFTSLHNSNRGIRMKFSKYIAFSSYRCIHMCISTCMHIHTQTCTQVNASYLLWDFGWRSIASSSSMSNQQVLSFVWCLMKPLINALLLLIVYFYICWTLSQIFLFILTSYEFFLSIFMALQVPFVYLYIWWILCWFSLSPATIDQSPIFSIKQNIILFKK